MAIDLRIPEVGESITEVQIGQWLKAEGNSVNRDDPLAVIDSEKTTFELPSPENGVLTRILHPAGDVVRVGEVIAQIEPGTDPKATAATGQMEPELNPEPEKPPGAATGPRPKVTEKKSGTPKPSPAPAAAPADQKQKSVGDTGPAPDAPPPGPAPRGEKTDEPPATPAKAQEPTSSQRPAPPPRERPSPAPTPTAQPERGERNGGSSAPRPKLAQNGDRPDREEQTVPMSMLRRTVARRLVEAQREMASLSTFNEIDLSAVQTLRREYQEVFQKRYGTKLGFMSFFVKAAIDALKQFPQLNAEVRNTNVVYHNYFDIGVAISSERGLVVPVLRNAERLSFAETESAIAEFARRAGEGSLKPADLEGGTFTITNGGVFGSLLSTPIINPPQTGILGMHTIVERPIAVAGNVVIRPMMYVALSYDHRIVDGREAVLFLRRIREAIENPARMLLEV